MKKSLLIAVALATMMASAAMAQGPPVAINSNITAFSGNGISPPTGSGLATVAGANSKGSGRAAAAHGGITCGLIPDGDGITSGHPNERMLN